MTLSNSPSTGAAAAAPSTNVGGAASGREVDYIMRFQWVCNQYLSDIADPRGKTVLVIGTGHGTEMLWSLRRGAREVVGIDPAPRNIDSVDAALARYGEERTAPVELLRMRAEEVHTLGRRFDLVLSHNVFEHIGDVEGALLSIREAVEPGVGRVAIFTSPLYHSSAGSHLLVEPWQHLHDSEEAIRDVAPNDLAWTEYLELNRMTATRLLDAIRLAGLSVHQFRTVPDRNLDKLAAYRPLIDPGISTTDLSIEGVATELSYQPG